MRAVDVDDDGVEAALAGGDEAPGVVGDEFAARRFAQEVLFGDGLDRRVDVDVGVAVARLAVRQREAAGAEDEDVALAVCQFVEQNLAQALDVARVVGRFGIVDQRGRRLVDPEGARLFLAGQGGRADDVFGVGGVGGDFVVQVEADGDCCG